MVTRFHPLERGYIVTSGFGWRDFDRSVHTGIDFGFPGGSGGRPVFAIQAGTVIHAGAASGYGGPAPAGWVVIDSDDEQGAGVFEYGHIVGEVAVGARVSAGQRIGRINPDGRTNGGVAPHLHVSRMPREYKPSAKQDFAGLLAGADHPLVAPKPDPKPKPKPKPKPEPKPEPKSPPPKGSAMKPAYREIISIGSSSSPRHGARITNFFLHTQEGNGTAESLAAYLNNSANGASYHYTVRDGIVVAVVDTDRASWSCLDANARSINLCFAGSRAAFTREQWLERRRDIEIAAWLACEDAKKYPYLKPVVNGRPYPLGNVACFSDHYFVTRVLGIGDHTDVGANFPWDVFAAAVKRYLSPAPPVPVVNRIDEAAAKNGWLGKRLTVGENACPDGRGRWAKFEHGYIYWTPTTGAHPIPNLLFEAWAEYGFERGPLGYPTVDRTILPVGAIPIGEVQAFEKGVLYRRHGQPGFYVHGAIGARWARECYEKGRLGWPTSNETPTDDGGRRQTFERGALIWHPSGAVEVQA